MASLAVFHGSEKIGCIPEDIPQNCVFVDSAHAIPLSPRSRLGSDGYCFSSLHDALGTVGLLDHLQQRHSIAVAAGVPRCLSVDLSWSSVVIRGLNGGTCQTPDGRTWRPLGMLQCARDVSLHSNARRHVAFRTF